MVSGVRLALVFAVPMATPSASSSWQGLFLHLDFMLGKWDRGSHPKLLPPQ